MAVRSLWLEEALVGAEDAPRLARASADAVGEIGAFCTEHGIDCHFRYDGWLWTATSKAQIGAWESTVCAVERHGVEAFVRLEPEEGARRAGAPTHVAGVLATAGAT